jgi:hypothetical protein
MPAGLAARKKPARRKRRSWEPPKAEVEKLLRDLFVRHKLGVQRPA